MEKPKPLKLVPTDLYETSPERYYSTYSMDPYIAELKASLEEMVDFALWYKQTIQNDYYFIDSRLDRAQAVLKEDTRIEEVRLGETRYGLHSTDDDLRDEVAKAAMPIFMKNNTWQDAIAMSFEMADYWMAERSRRREGR